MKRIIFRRISRVAWIARIGLVLVVASGLAAACSGSDDALDARATSIAESSDPTATASAETSPTEAERRATATTEPDDSATSTATPDSDTIAEALTETPFATRTREATATGTENPDVELAEFQSQASELVGAVDGLAEVMVALPDGTTIFEANASEPMESASLYKLPIVIEVFRLRDVGAISFDQQIELREEYFMEEDEVYGTEMIGAFVDIGALVDNTVTLSSNVAPKALLAMTGNEAINVTMRSIGLTGTEVRWSPAFVGLPNGGVTLGEGRALASTRVDGTSQLRASNDIRADDALNVTTAGDMALLMRKLVNGEVFSAATSQEIVDLLARQQINDRMPAYLPEGTVVAHKTGNLDGLVHDVGVIFAPDGPIVVAVLVETWDEGYAAEVIREIAKGVYGLGS